MERMFGAGNMIQDAVPPRSFRRGRHTKRPRVLAAALGVATATLLLARSVVYGGATSGPERVTVHTGDTLWAIASSHYPGDDVQARVVQIEAANHLAGAGLNPGQILT